MLEATNCEFTRRDPPYRLAPMNAPPVSFRELAATWVVTWFVTLVVVCVVSFVLAGAACDPAGAEAVARDHVAGDHR
jgi:hypothetical protein